MVEAQEVAISQLSQHLRHLERDRVPGQAGDAGRSPGVQEGSQHGLMHCPQATFGGRDTATASASQRIQPPRVTPLGRRGQGLLDRIAELAG